MKKILITIMLIFLNISFIVGGVFLLQGSSYTQLDENGGGGDFGEPRR